jgi:hypothetical protein
MGSRRAWDEGRRGGGGLVGVTSETARAPRTETYAVLLGSNDAIKADQWFRAQMWRALNNLRKVLGKKIPWKISEARLIEILEEMELPEWRYGKYVAALRRDPVNFYLSFSLYVYGLVSILFSYACSGLYH